MGTARTPCKAVDLGGQMFRVTHSHAGRAVAVATAIFGVTLLALIVPMLAARLFGAAAATIWRTQADLGPKHTRYSASGFG